jgi:hypothetical protein
MVMIHFLPIIIWVKLFPLYWHTLWIRESVVGIATSYGLGDREVTVRVPVGPKTFYSPRCSDEIWGPPNLLSNGYRGHFLEGKAAGT